MIGLLFAALVLVGRVDRPHLRLDACTPPIPSTGPHYQQRGLVDLLPTLPPPPLRLGNNPHPPHTPAVRMSPSAVARVYGAHSQQSGNANNSPVEIGKSNLLAHMAGGSAPIRESYELYCGDFDEKCKWRNLEGLFVDELDWYQGAGFLDEARLRLATGTHIRPDGFYSIAATDKIEFPGSKAVLISDVIECQSGMAEFRFQYWTSPEVRIVVCTKTLVKLYPDYDFCSQPVENGDPGPASINLPDLNGHAFQIYLRAENFIFHTANLQGGFAIIDNIEYNGVLCSSTDPPPTAGVGEGDTGIGGIVGEQKMGSPQHLPALTLLPPMIQHPRLVSNHRDQLQLVSEKGHPHEMSKAPLREPLPLAVGAKDRDGDPSHPPSIETQPSPGVLTVKSMQMHRRRPSHPSISPPSGILPPVQGETGNLDHQMPSGHFFDRYHIGGGGHHQQQQGYWPASMPGQYYPLLLASAQTQLVPDPTEEPSSSPGTIRKFDSDACFALNCSFDDHCAEYVLKKGVDWQLSRRPVGNPLTGIRGDASRLPYNRDGTFVYVVGPKLLSRFSTRPFTLYKSAYLMFAYHKVGRKSELRMLVKRVNAEHEEVLFEAPRLAIESRRWFREVRRLAADTYSYLAFEVQNLPPNTYVGIDEQVLLDEETREPLCKSAIPLNTTRTETVIGGEDEFSSTTHPGTLSTTITTSERTN